MGMLSAPTSFMRYVCNSCGAYWIAARIAEVTPRNVAQEEIRWGMAPSGDGGTVTRR